MLGIFILNVVDLNHLKKKLSMIINDSNKAVNKWFLSK